MEKNYILFPSAFENIKEVDPDFLVEAEIATNFGFTPIFYDYDLYIRKGYIEWSKIPFCKNSIIYYRGWMLNEPQYRKLYSFFKLQNLEFINSPDLYLLCHHSPNYYPLIKDDLPKMIWVEDRKELDQFYIKFFLMKSDVIIKDYVKSAKENGILKIKNSTSKLTFIKIIDAFIEARGKLFNVGITLKKYHNLKKYFQVWQDNRPISSHTNEWRYFVLGGKIITKSVNSILPSMVGVDIPDDSIVQKIIPQITSNFFTVDVAQLEDGTWMIIELGDGQVSGLAINQNPLEFYSKLYGFFHYFQKYSSSE